MRCSVLATALVLLAGCRDSSPRPIYLYNGTPDAVRYQLDSLPSQGSVGYGQGRSAYIKPGPHTLRCFKGDQVIDEVHFDIGTDEYKSVYRLYSVQGAAKLAIVNASSLYKGSGLSEWAMDKDFRVVHKCVEGTLCTFKGGFSELVMEGDPLPAALAPSQSLYYVQPIRADQADAQILEKAAAALGKARR